MPEELALSEYRKLAVDLPHLQPFGNCCSSALLNTVYVEPLEGRNTLEVDRTCILQCPKCEKMYVSRWD
jgi:hypothetical protein